MPPLLLLGCYRPSPAVRAAAATFAAHLTAPPPGNCPTRPSRVALCRRARQTTPLTSIFLAKRIPRAYRG
ncbi:hypothetical protein VPH35_002854 [Triticum aestivum]